VRAALGREADALVPAGLILPEPPEGGVSRGKIGPLVLVRGEAALFAGEAALWDALVPEGARCWTATGRPWRRGWRRVMPRRRSIWPGMRLRPGRCGGWPCWRGWSGRCLWVAQAGRWQFDVWRAEAARWRGCGAVSASGRTCRGAGAGRARRAARQAGADGLGAGERRLVAGLAGEPRRAAGWLGHDEDGTLHVTLAAGSAAAIDAVMLALQRDGWRLAPPPAPVQRWGRGAGDDHGAGAMTGLLDWFRALSGRERRLVVVAAGLGLAVVLAQGVGVPLAGLWQDARADHDARLAQAARLVRQLDELGPPSRGRPAPLAGLVAQGPGPGW
jgi:hypothetical protein